MRVGGGVWGVVVVCGLEGVTGGWRGYVGRSGYVRVGGSYRGLEGV